MAFELGATGTGGLDGGFRLVDVPFQLKREPLYTGGAYRGDTARSEAARVCNVFRACSCASYFGCDISRGVRVMDAGAAQGLAQEHRSGLGM